MAFSEKLTLIVDVVTGQSKSALSKLKTDLANADGALGKMKTSASAAGNFLKQNLATAGLAVGTAMVGMAKKSVDAFQDTALGAGQLRDSLGVTADEASRLQEVAGDLGIGVEAVESAIGRMNKTAASSPEAFDEIGASIVRNADGTTNVVETFKSAAEAISEIPDATKRAEAAQKIFGRGYQSIAELIMQGSDGITAAMASVEEGKLINDKQIGQAREFRDSLDKLKGIAEELAIELGGALVPAITDVANAAGDAKPAIDILAMGMEAGPWNKPDIRDNLEGWQHSLERFRDEVGLVNDELIQAGMQGLLSSLNYEEMRGLDAILTGIKGIKEARQAEVDAAQAAVDAERANVEAYISHQAGMAAATEAAQAKNAEAMRKVGEAGKTAAEGVADLTAAIIDSTNTVFDSESAQLALADAVDSYKDAIDEAKTVAKDDESTQRDREAALRDVREAELTAAAGALTAAKAYADEQGAAEGSRKSAKLQVDALTMMQAQYPELREEIQTYIDKLNKVPTKKETKATVETAEAAQRLRNHVKDLDGISKEKKTDILALINQGKLQEARGELQELADAEYAAHIDAMAETEAARGSIRSIEEGAYSATVDVHGDATPLDETIAARQGTDIWVDVLARNFGLGGGGGAAPGGGSTDSLGGGTGSAGGGNRSDRLLKEADALLRKAATLKASADALRDQAAATEDAERKDKLLEDTEKLLEQRTDALTSAREKQTKAADLAAKAIRQNAAELDREAEALRNNSAAQQERSAAAAEGLREQASSFQEFANAALAVEDAQERANEARATARRALNTEGVTPAQREEAVEAARDAALALVDAQVEQARERAERSGREFTEEDEIRARRAALRRQAARGGPVGQELREFIEMMNFPQQLRLVERAERREERAAENARQQEAAAKALERAANKMERFADRVDNAAPGRVGDFLDRHILRLVERALRERLRAIDAGTR